jgi:dipeptidyl aminopeptidase/acylaminoacyl peptidase
MKNLIAPTLILVFALACNRDVPDDTPMLENDIPQPISSKVSLAGSSEPDIVRFLKVRSAIAPSLSPDGKWVAYRTRITGDYQIWVTGSDQLTIPHQITFGNSVTFHKWSPDNNVILYGTDMEGNEKEGFYMVSKDGLQEIELLPPSEAYRFFGDFNKDGSQFTYSTTERNGTDFDVHIYDLRSGTDKRVLEGKLGYYPVSFSPDGQLIVISESMGEDANNLFILDVSNSSLTQLNNPDDHSYFGDIQWKSDSRSFFLRTNSGKDFIGVALYSIENQSFEYVFQENNDVEQIIATENNALHLVSNHHGYSVHTMLNLSNGKRIKVPVWPKGTLSLAASTQGSKIIGYVRSPEIPGDLWSWSAGSTEAVRITHSSSAGIDLERMILPEAHSFKARDGLTIHGLLYSPENMQEHTPLIIKVHGGPTSQARPTFDALTQYLVNKGFAIFDLNYRGSTGFGKTYARENNLRKREQELYDLEDAVRYLVDSGFADGKSTAVMGRSYGGYLTMAAMTRLPEVFDCGVSFVGVSNWITALEGASPALKASDRLEYGDIDNPEDRLFLESISPIKYIDQVKSPVMVLHGANDPRDPVTESDWFVSGIRQNGGKVEYLRFPNEGHGIRKMENRITAYVRVSEFLERNLPYAELSNY